MKRYLTTFIKKDLKKKMVFLGGPRQVGKTTLSLQILGVKTEGHPAYLNWDEPETRKNLLSGYLPSNEKLLVLDEIHKYKGWRSLIKGFYDTRKSKTSFLVTGSAKLDYYRKGGDSLIGRYFFYRLHPLSLYEIGTEAGGSGFDRLLKFGGFPEMFLSATLQDWKRWQKERITRVVRDDLLSLEQVKDVTQLELLAAMLNDRVGSTLSIKSLSEDLSASHEAVKRWVQILENIYFCYRISPYGSSRIRALKKDQKLYLWDWSTIENKGYRFENLVSGNLLKYCHFLEDTEGEKMELRFLRDKEKREVDFVVLKNNHPVFAVECKTGDQSLSKNICYYAERTEIPLFYQIHLSKKDYQVDRFRARVLPFETFVKQVIKI